MPNYGRIRTRSAASLHKLGIQKGDRVAVCLPSWNEFVVIYMAVAHLGAILVPFNTNHKYFNEVGYILRNSQTKIAFITKEFSGLNYIAQYTPVNEHVPSLEKLFSVRSNIEGMQSYEQLVEEGKSLFFSPVEINPAEHVYIILYTFRINRCTKRSYVYPSKYCKPCHYLSRKNEEFS